MGAVRGFQMRECCYFLLAAGLCLGADFAYTQTRVDLEIESVQVSPPRQTSKNEIEVTVHVRNNGSEEARGVYLSLDLYYENKKIRTLNEIPVLSHLPRSGAGQSIPISLGVLPAGGYEVMIMADPDARILETNESNNIHSVSFNVS